MEMGWLVVPPRGSQRRAPLDVIVRGRVVERWEAVVLARERQSWDGDLASVVNNSGFPSEVRVDDLGADSEVAAQFIINS